MTAVTDVPTHRASADSAVSEAISMVPDPEVPVISIADLGILRAVDVDDEAASVRVTITPTYSGCPAMEAIRDHIVHVAAKHGYAADVRTQLSPAWTTDWISESGKQALRRFGIAPPGAAPREAGPVAVSLTVRTVTCPLCGSTDTTELSRFGSTACKALRRCNTCREPFDEFKAI